MPDFPASFFVGLALVNIGIVKFLNFVRDGEAFLKSNKVPFGLVAVFLLFFGLFTASADESSSQQPVQPIDNQEQTFPKKLSLIHTEKQAEQTLSEILKNVLDDSEGKYFDAEINEAEAFLDFLTAKEKTWGVRAVGKMCLLFRQDKYANVEDLSSLYGPILWDHTSDGVKAMVDAKKELLPEFKNADFYETLYSLGVYVPYDNTDLSEAERTQKAKPFKDRLKALRNSSNADFIDYLLSGEKIEDWTY